MHDQIRKSRSEGRYFEGMDSKDILGLTYMTYMSPQCNHPKQLQQIQTHVNIGGIQNPSTPYTVKSVCPVLAQYEHVDSRRAMVHI